MDQGQKSPMATTHPLDTNQIRSRIGDLKERVSSLRGYL
jgi:predicted Zn-dependent protease